MALRTVPPFLRGDGFALLRDGARLHVLVGDERRWTIDPAMFGGRAEVAVVQGAQETTISLQRAVFAGTTLPADFVCTFQKQAGVWMLRLSMECGIEVSAALLDWLNGRSTASGSWKTLHFAPFDELSIVFRSTPSVIFTPEWTLAISAPSIVTVRGLQQTLPVSTFAVLLNAATTLSGTPSERSTTIIAPRGNERWKIDLSRQSNLGWALDHDADESLFDELHVEASHSNNRILRSALLMQTPGNNTAVYFQPGGALSTDSGEPFAMPLQNPRLAFSLDHEPQSSLVADIHDQALWAHDTDVSYLFGTSADAPHFELHEGLHASGTPQISPGICEICFPNDAVCMNLKLGVPRPVPFTWADFVAPFERFMGWLHLVPTRDENHKLIFDLEAGDCLSIERPTDLLSLQFQFENMRLITGICPRIVHVKGKGDAKVNVIFPPQHAAEEAFYHTDGSGIPPGPAPVGPVELGDYDDPAVTTVAQLALRLDPDSVACDEPDKPRPGITLSKPTRLSFDFPASNYEIPCEIHALLNWSDWHPRVAPVAKSDIRISTPADVPPITAPKPFDTSIEIPYQLNISPSDLGRWAHSVKPVESKEHVVELWHTRLGVKLSKGVAQSNGPRNSVDETNAKDRTVRAVWSPDFVPVPLAQTGCAPGHNNFPDHYKPGDPPFRMSLDIRDRCELVHLTSNYAITQQAHFCDNGRIFPLDPKDLLPPAPVQINRLMLTAMGGYLEAFGQWNPCKVDGSHQLTVQMWEHIATLGRDHYVKVVYKGYLAPFGLRASLVKVTQRYFQLNADNNWVAILHQHMYIVMKNERKQCPILGQPYGGRAFPFSYVEPITLRTPFLSDPAKQCWPRPEGNLLQAQSLFWPMVPDPTNPVKPVIFSFRLRFTDITGVHSAESSMPLLFVASDVAQGDNRGKPIPSTAAADYASQDAVYFYNRGSMPRQANAQDPYLVARFAGQMLSFASSVKPGDTDFETDTISWRAAPLAASITVNVTGATANAYVTITPAVSNNILVQPLASAGPYTLVVDSGPIIVSVTTPQSSSNPSLAVATGSLPIAANSAYTLNLALADPTHFATPPVLTESGAGTGPSPRDLYHYDLPFFYPAVDYALITSTSIKRITGSSTPTKFNFYPTYLSDGFNTSSNSGEVLLQKHPDDTLTLQFGARGNVDKAGGLASPDTLVVGFSRKGGPVGGKSASADSTAQGNTGATAPVAANSIVTSASTFSSGKFDPADFFGGLLSAKLLGAVKLSDIIAPLSSGLSNLAQAPQMLEQALYEAEEYTKACTDAIAAFQRVGGNPLASRLSAQAQQVAAGRAALVAAQAANDIVGGAVIEAELVARIADYTAALQGALQNPLALVEDAVLQALTSAVETAINNIRSTAQAQIDAFTNLLNTELDLAIQNLLLALAPLEHALADSVVDAITLADQLAKNNTEPIQNLVSVLAPELSNVVQLKSLIPSLKNDISALGRSIHAALSDSAQLPQALANGGAVLANLQQIYQSAGFLGVIVSKAQLATDPLNQALIADRGKLLALWNLANFSADLTTLHDDCLKVASYYDQTVAQQILQNINQLEISVNKAISYKNRVANVPPQPTPPVPQSAVNLYRELQLLQKMQGQILSALATLQTLALALPTTAPAPIGKAATDINAAIQTLAASLTIASQLCDSTLFEQQLTELTSDPDARRPLNASASDTLQQIVALRDRIRVNPLDVGLRLLVYNLSIDYQRPLATALAYIAYIQTGADAAIAQYLPAILDPIEKLANALQGALCALNSAWVTFRSSLKALQGPLNTPLLKALQGPLNTPLSPIIDSLFGSDLDAISAAFTALSCGSQTTPSEYLRNGRALIAAFVALEKDVRAKISSLPAVEAALLQAVKVEIDSLLATLLSNIPLPTSVNLSYTWHPTIQSCAPVFMLNPGADFSVKAAAQAGLNQDLSVNAAVDITASLTNFSIVLIGDVPFITLVIDSLSFTSHNGSKPDCRLKLQTVVFGASMKFVQDLAELLDPTDGPFIELAAGSIRAGFRFAIESMTLGAFNLMQLAIEVAVALPFDGTPVRCEFGLSDQQQPFLLSCGIYGGGGFLQLQLGLDGVQLLQGAFEFGVCADISIGPLVGSGFVVAGIYFRITGDDSEVCGFVHAHGHMDIFGIVTLDVDLYVAICYDDGCVQGVATFSVSVSIGFFSETFSMQAQYSFGGSGTKNSTSSAMLEMSDRPIEAFLVSPETDSDFAIDAYLESERSGQPQQDAGPKSICPGPWQQKVVDERVWAKYYNSFM